MKRISKPTNLNLFNPLFPVVAGCNDNYQSKSVQTTNSNSTVKEEERTSWKDELLKRSTIAYVDHNNSTGFFYLQKQMDHY